MYLDYFVNTTSPMYNFDVDSEHEDHSEELLLFVGCIVNFIVSYLICMFQDSVPAGSYNDPFLSSVCVSGYLRFYIYIWLYMYVYIYTHTCIQKKTAGFVWTSRGKITWSASGFGAPWRLLAHELGATASGGSTVPVSEADQKRVDSVDEMEHY